MIFLELMFIRRGGRGSVEGGEGKKEKEEEEVG